MMRWIAITAALLVAVSGGAADAAPDPGLIRAFEYLQVGQYRGAQRLVTLYLASNPHRFDADFILAFADCKLSKGGPDAQAGAKALSDDYTLAGKALEQVTALQNACRPPPPPPPDHDDNGIGMTASAIGPPPPRFDVAAPSNTAPLALPKMSPLLDGVSFSGDDYWHQTTATADACTHICRLQTQCRAITFIKSGYMCYLKRSVPPPQYGADFVSSRKIITKPLPPSAP